MKNKNSNNQKNGQQVVPQKDFHVKFIDEKLKNLSILRNRDSPIKINENQIKKIEQFLKNKEQNNQKQEQKPNSFFVNRPPKKGQPSSRQQ